MSPPGMAVINARWRTVFGFEICYSIKIKAEQPDKHIKQRFFFVELEKWLILPILHLERQT